MKPIFFLASALLAAVILFSNCEKPSPQNDPETLAAIQAGQVARGKYLMGSMGCDDCHTPKKMTAHGPEPDLERRFMGHPAAEHFEYADKKQMIEQQHVAVFSPGMTATVGPWGISYAANLTPDETGTGNWTEAQFIKAIREGKSKGLDGTRPLLPPMPWPVYATLTDEDLKSIYAFLRTVKPINNVVPNPQSW